MRPRWSHASGVADVGRTLPAVVLQIWGLGMITYLTLTDKITGLALLPVLAVAAGITQIPAYLSARKAKAVIEEVEAR